MLDGVRFEVQAGTHCGLVEAFGFTGAYNGAKRFVGAARPIRTGSGSP